jgi:hypothetical protein
MRRAPLLLFSCALATGSLACTDATEPGIVNDEDPLTSENGLASNGLASNGLASNGLASNALTSNGLASNGLASNGLVIGALRDQSPTGDLTRMFFRYLVSCALPPNHSVSYTWTDSTGKLHTEVNPGGLGLAPGWENGPANQTDKEVISACMAARTNSKGIPVPLSLRGKAIAGLTVTSSERSQYTYGEGAFWGNIFASQPYVYSCSRVAFSAGIATSSYLSQGRTCTVGGCGVITAVGPCYTSDIATSGQACFERDGAKDWVSSCDSQMRKSAPMSTNVLTTWLMP